MYVIVDHICFAIFVAHYYLDYGNKDENDSQPDVLSEETKETSQGVSKTLPKSLPLISSSEKLKGPKTRQVLRYQFPNKHLHTEKIENALKVNNTYRQKLVEEFGQFNVYVIQNCCLLFICCLYAVYF